MKKTFILTLFMMLCSFTFGQNITPKWSVGDNGYNYPFTAAVITTVSIDGVPQTNENIEIAAFCGDDVRGSVMLEMTPFNDAAIAFLSVFIGESNEVFTFKAYDHNAKKEYNNVIQSISINPDGTLGESLTPYSVSFNKVASIGDVYYSSLEEAVAAAQAGNTVTLLKDVEIPSVLALDKSLAIDLNGKTVEGTTNRLFRITEEAVVTISNGTILNEVSGGRCIETRTGDVTLNLNKVELIAETGASQPLTVGGYGNNIKVNATSSTISAGAGYGITTFNPVVMTLDDTDVSGYAALNIKVASGSVGSAGSKFNIVNGSELIGTNNADEGESNSFCTVMVEDKNVTINVEESTLKAVANKNPQAILGLGNEYVTTAVTGLKVSVDANSTLSLEGAKEASILGLHDNQVLGDNSITVPARYAEQLKLEGWVVSAADANGLVTVLGTPVAAIGGTKYHTLAAAIKEATAGQTITLLANVTESVTVNKNLTIDGDGFDYTGTMTGNKGITLTVNNVDFVNGGFTTPMTQGTTGVYTFTNCKFDGAETYAYPIRIYGAETINVTGCEVKDYQYSFLYVTSATLNVNVNNVKVEDCPSYAIYFASGMNNCTIEGLTVKNSGNGIIYNNTADRTLTLKDCTFENVTNAVNHSNGTSTITCNFQGVSEIGGSVFSQYAKIVAGGQVGTKIYGDFAEAYAAVPAGGTIKMYNNAEIGTTLNVPHSLTIDGNGHALTYTGSDRAIEVSYKAEKDIDLTISNLDVNFTKTYCQRGINYNENGTLTLNGVEVNGGSAVTYALNLPGSSDGAEIEITDSRLKGNIALNVWGEETNITATASEFYSVDNSAAEGYAAIAFNNDGTISCAGSVVRIDGGKIIAKDEENQPSTAVSNAANVDFKHSVNNETEIVGEIKVPVALVKYEGQDQFYSCFTLQEAIDEAKDNATATVLLMSDIESSEIIKIEGDVVIDLNGKTVEGTINRLFRITEEAVVTISNGRIENNVSGGRCIETRTGDVTLNLEGVVLKAEKDASQPLTVGGSGNNIKVNATSSTISAGTGYGITTFNPVVMTLDGTKVSGYAALNIKVENSSLGSAGSVFNIKNGSELIGTNNAAEGESNSFCTVMVEDKNVTINVERSTLKAVANNNPQAILGLGNEYVTTAVTGLKVSVDANSTLALDGPKEASILGLHDNQVLGDNSITVPAVYATQLQNEGWATNNIGNGLVTIVLPQAYTLYKGYNWYSSYININGVEGLQMLQNAITPYAAQIKSQYKFTSYISGPSGSGWSNYGGNTLTEASVTEMYLIKMDEKHSFNMTGNMVDPQADENAIVLHNGWNWIGYPMNVEMSLADAIPTPTHGDQIKSHLESFAQYVEFNGQGAWYGGLKTMKPGQGYMYQSRYVENGEAAIREFNYSYSRGTKEAVEANITAENNYWTLNASQYANNMTMVATLSIGGEMMSEDYEVAAFVNGEVRGSARPIYIEPMDAYMIFLTIHGKDVEEVTFKCIDLTTGEEYMLNEAVNYSDNASLGSVEKPFALSYGTMGVGENGYSAMKLYPNPTTTNTAINLASVCEIVEVFNSLGAKVAEYRNVDSIDGIETAGVYVIRVTNGSTVQNCRLIVK